jgi:hypothetical protein
MRTLSGRAPLLTNFMRTFMGAERLFRAYKVSRLP